ncbi:MAG: hypothetical protein E6Q62_08145 [Nitrosomonas sp.]|nr:MAG: hypothetical protein E6Q62_08145 [Nitrosomonas sp.]
MNFTGDKLSFGITYEMCLKIYQALSAFSVGLLNKKIVQLSLFVIVFLLAGCKTVPIYDRSFAERGGFWEQGENSSTRFHHTSFTDKAVIGRMYAVGRSTLLNRNQVKNSSEIKNHAFVITGPESSARIEFKSFDSTCIVRIKEFNFGNAYSDSSDCLHIIDTLHATIQAKNAILQIKVASNQTEVTVISGVIKIALRANLTYSIDAREDQEITIVRDAINRPRALEPDEIWRRIAWRDDYQFYKSAIDWSKVIAIAVTGAIIVAVILLGRSSGRGAGGFSRSHRWR